MYKFILIILYLFHGCFGQGDRDGSLHANFLANQIAELLRNNRGLEASVFGVSPGVDAAGSSIQDVGSPGGSGNPPPSSIRLGNALFEGNLGGTSGGQIGLMDHSAAASQFGIATIPGNVPQVGGVNNLGHIAPNGPSPIMIAPRDTLLEPPPQEVSVGSFGPGTKSSRHRRPRPQPISMNPVNIGNTAELPTVSLPGHGLFGSEMPVTNMDTIMNPFDPNAAFTDVSLQSNPSTIDVLGNGPITAIGHGQNDLFTAIHQINPQEQNSNFNHGTPVGTPLGQAQVDWQNQHDVNAIQTGVTHASHGSHAEGTSLGQTNMERPFRLGATIDRSQDIPFVDSQGHTTTALGSLFGSVDTPGEHNTLTDGAPDIHRVEHKPSSHKPHDVFPPDAVGQFPTELPVQHDIHAISNPGIPLGGAHNQHTDKGSLLGSVHIDLPGEHGNPIDGVAVIHRVDHKPDSHKPHDVFPPDARHGSHLGQIHTELPIHQDTHIGSNPGIPFDGGHNQHAAEGSLLGSVHVDMLGENINQIDGAPVIHRVEHKPGLHKPRDVFPPELRHGTLLGPIHTELPVVSGIPLEGTLDILGEHNNPSDGLPGFLRVEHKPGSHASRHVVPSVQPGVTVRTPLGKAVVEHSHHHEGLSLADLVNSGLDHIGPHSLRDSPMTGVPMHPSLEQGLIKTPAVNIDTSHAVPTKHHETTVLKSSDHIPTAANHQQATRIFDPVTVSERKTLGSLLGIRSVVFEPPKVVNKITERIDRDNRRQGGRRRGGRRGRGRRRNWRRQMGRRGRRRFRNDIENEARQTATLQTETQPSQPNNVFRQRPGGRGLLRALTQTAMGVIEGRGARGFGLLSGPVGRGPFRQGGRFQGK